MTGKGIQFSERELRELHDLVGNIDYYLLCHIMGEEFAENSNLTRIYNKIDRFLENEGKEKKNP